ncbi:hypothetical protein BJV82DRAFT_73845 [Fennellomyces sp. T-0311]|nr:hypothetical protein BJV82DRAFT_73845 [Fennellomyces sp. T-0311]
MINQQPSHHDELSNSDPQLLTEETGQRILQRLDDLYSRIDYIEEAIQRGNLGPQGTAQQTRPAVDGSAQPPQERSQRCKKPKIEDEDGNQVAEIRVEHIDEALRDHFRVDPDNIVSTRTDLTKHLRGVVRVYIEEQLEHRHKLPPASTPWKHIPKPLVFRAIEKFEEQAERVLRIRLGDCEGSWIARYCLHTGWNNFIAPERKKE